MVRCKNEDGSRHNIYPPKGPTLNAVNIFLYSDAGQKHSSEVKIPKPGHKGKEK